MEIPKEERFAANPPLGSLLTMPQPMCRSELDVKIYPAHGEFGYTLKEIADFMGVHYATASRAVKRAEMKLSDCKT